MGRPVLYSSEVPARCQALITMLSHQVEEQSDPEGKWGGPLKTTFLLAMATPMLVLPVERIFKPIVRATISVANDVALDPSLAERVGAALGTGQPFGATPFYQPSTWSYIPDCAAFDVARDWPSEPLDQLGSPQSEAAAGQAEVGDILECLRNALAHGGITYLDRNGRHTQFATNMLGFASRPGRRYPGRLRLLRATVPGFEAFLQLWADWLSMTGVTDALDLGGPGYFDRAAE